MGPQMNCPHCNESIAVRLDKPGAKAKRRRELRRRKSDRLRAVREDEASSEEE